MTIAPNTRATQERANRMVLIAGLAPTAPCAAVLIWYLGYTVHPHRVALACIIAAVLVVVNTAVQWLRYRLVMKRIRELP